MKPQAAAGGRLLDSPVGAYGDAVNGQRADGDWQAERAGQDTGNGAAARADGGAWNGSAASVVAGVGLAQRVAAAPGLAAELAGAFPAGGWWGRALSTLGLLRRQLAGGAEVDQFGFDPEFNDRVLLPVGRLLYRHWFDIQLRNTQYVPAEGPALVVANHSGTLPLDAVMLGTGLHDEHPAHRNLRLLGANLVYDIPVLANVARKGGHARACPADADELLGMGEIVGVFPEGFKGIGKPFSERYQLRRFGRGGFAATAMRARVPIIPCAIVGAEEIYPLIGNIKPLARLLRLPYFPVTPLFPWLGPVGAVPLPSRWIIAFCPPVPTTGYAPGDERDPAAVADLSGRVRGIVQRKLDDLLAERGPAFG